MRLDNRKILVGVIALTLLLFPVVAFSTGPLRLALGLLLVIFFPGYTLLSALFPRQDSLGGIEHLALSFGLSIAVVPLIGLILNYTPWGIRLFPILMSIALFIVATSAVGWYRQRRLPAAERFSVTFKTGAPNWGGMTKLDRGLSISLVVAIVAALVSLGYVVAAPKEGEKFTELPQATDREKLPPGNSSGCTSRMVIPNPAGVKMPNFPSIDSRREGLTT